ASDIPAVLKFSRRCYVLEDGEIARVRPGGIEFFDLNGREIAKKPEKIEWNVESAERGGFQHFMLKEIHEEPAAVKQTLGRYVKDGLPDLGDALDEPCDRLTIVACGTAMHAGLVGKWLIERLARVPVEVSIASEFRYNEPVLKSGQRVIAISQSGETADTLAAVRLAKQLGAKVLAVVNVPGSSVAREAEDVLITCAGPEISVASTKAYTVQLVMLYLIAVQIGLVNGALDGERARALVREMQELPRAVERVIAESGQIRRMAKLLDEAENCFFIGRGLDCPGAMEGSLKLKEISYIHSESYAAGELKHGAISLITAGMPVVALATNAQLKEKMRSNMREVRSRGAKVLLIAADETRELNEDADEAILLPKASALFSPVTAAVAMQLLAYYAAVRRGCDVDKPRNLAKSVTVE
ncbi:MAG: glutamine--fructose-6-phosphate transaminase (isomerizing), partial [Clostridiales bacterium]|nr:glutamine--fructose-6-phosphate transaminase (isomerizing) [Clostridiales bacterium]